MSGEFPVEIINEYKETSIQKTLNEIKRTKIYLKSVKLIVVVQFNYG